MTISSVEWSFVSESGRRGQIDVEPSSERDRSTGPAWVVADVVGGDDRIKSLEATFSLDDGWIVTADLPFVGGQLMAGEIRVRHVDGPRPAIGGRTWQRFRLAQIESILASDTPWIIDGVMPRALAPVGYVKPRPGRRGETDRFYAEKARRYVEAAVASGGRPIPFLVAEDGSDTTAERRRWPVWIKTAEARGLITDRHPGKASGRLTDRALRILNGAAK